MGEFLSLKKDDLVVYKGNMPYGLSNGQEVNYEGEELMINSNVNVQSKFFNFKNENIKEDNKNQSDGTVEVTKSDEKAEKLPENEDEEKSDLSKMNKSQLLKYAKENGIEVDGRKSDKKILEQINAFKK